MLVCCCTRLNNTSVSNARVEETESILVPGTPVVFYPHARVLPIKFTHSHVARLWGFIAPRVLGKSCPASTRPYRTTVSLPLFGHGCRHARVPGREVMLKIDEHEVINA
ncbi:hypothetical protein GOBAR_AA05194 [Gossypium barbadense]|uniref:Uncharacterized protein n=1 Tax=Gossypium barbadense TaxID=3634 RepID=A0A2P5YIG7_GOSBA|nr:hypothetical protein GOBAR_AA05194 [Gossypium barbadense]